MDGFAGVAKAESPCASATAEWAVFWAQRRRYHSSVRPLILARCNVESAHVPAGLQCLSCASRGPLLCARTRRKASRGPRHPASSTCSRYPCHVQCTNCATSSSTCTSSCFQRGLRTDACATNAHALCSVGAAGEASMAGSSMRMPQGHLAMHMLRKFCRHCSSDSMWVCVSSCCLKPVPPGSHTLG